MCGCLCKQIFHHQEGKKKAPTYYLPFCLPVSYRLAVEATCPLKQQIPLRALVRFLSVTVFFFSRLNVADLCNLTRKRSTAGASKYLKSKWTRDGGWLTKAAADFGAHIFNCVFSGVMKCPPFERELAVSGLSPPGTGWAMARCYWRWLCLNP